MSLILLLKCGPDAESGRVIRLLREGHPVIEGGRLLRLWSAYAFGRLLRLWSAYALDLHCVSHTLQM
jgi:hypothetical protein